MTNDNFTGAARAEAERRWPRGQADGSPLPGHARMSRRIGFEIGALWARTHVAAQEPTDAEVEAADRGRVEHNVRRRLTDAEWAATRSSIEHQAMRAALSAARAARRDEEKR